MATPKLRYEEEIRLLNQILEFFGEKLPHSVGASLDHLQEAANSMELFESLSAKSDAELKSMGITREDLSKISAAATGLFAISNKARNGK